MGGRSLSRQAVQREGPAAGGVAPPVRASRSGAGQAQSHDARPSNARLPAAGVHLEVRILSSRSCIGTNARRSPSASRVLGAAVVARLPALADRARAAPPASPRRAAARAGRARACAYRQRYHMPSAVSRLRSQLRQNGSVVDAMMPKVVPSGSRKRSAGADDGFVERLDRRRSARARRSSISRARDDLGPATSASRRRRPCTR